MRVASMTAFAKHEANVEGWVFRCEVKSLNSRFLDVYIRIPRNYMQFEPQLIATTKKLLARGKLEINFELQQPATVSTPRSINLDAFHQFQELEKLILDNSSLDRRPLSVAEILRQEALQENVSSQLSEDQNHWLSQQLNECLEKALETLIQVRLEEGKALATALRKLLETMRKQAATVQAQAIEIQGQLFSNYRKKLDKLLDNLEETGEKIRQQLSEERLLSEIAILTDKNDVDEELTRLSSHIDAFYTCLEEESEIGRRLDFICQEMHREVNTLSNKLTNSKVTKNSLELKQIVEKLRQQVQNIE